MTRLAPIPIVLAFFVGLCVTAPASAMQDRGARRTADLLDEKLGFAESHALILGVSDYTNGWTDLPGVRADVDSVQAVLEALGFVTHRNAGSTSKELRDAIQEFILQYGKVDDNRILVYFAGHGYTDVLPDNRKLGYIIPSDAPHPNDDILGLRRKAISMHSFRSYAEDFVSRHVLFVFDACFAGTVFSGSRGGTEHLSDKLRYPVRQFITSGSANETVPDKSVFRELFALGLRGAADLTGDRFVTGTELGIFLNEKVKELNPGQTPQEGKLLNADLNRGEFVFALAGADTAWIEDVDLALLHAPRLTRDRVEEARRSAIRNKTRVNRLGHESSAYRLAELEEQNGLTALERDSLEAALKHFESANEHYTDAVVFALEMSEAMDSTRSRFESGIRRKDVTALQSLFVDLDDDDVASWARFFEVANAITVETAQRSVTPEGDSVILQVWADVYYSDNKNRNQSAHYEFRWRLREAGGVWKIHAYSGGAR